MKMKWKILIKRKRWRKMKGKGRMLRNLIRMKGNLIERKWLIKREGKNETRGKEENEVKNREEERKLNG